MSFGSPEIGAPPLQLAVVVPTLNERGNVEPFLEALERALAGMVYEVIFVDDDSPDGTAAELRARAARDPRIRVIQRIRRRGLASACIEGMMATAATAIAVMDADLQHDEQTLPVMFQKLTAGNFDIVVATRNADGGSMGSAAPSRVALSQWGRRLSESITGCRLSDPMSGYFMLRREYLDEVVRSASGIGFKILLDLIASAKRPVAIGEVPYTFRERRSGSSKLDVVVGVEYLQLLLDKKFGRFIPVRFLLFVGVGATGVAASLLVLLIAVRLFHADFVTAQIEATFLAMTGNFLLNNSMTYRDRRLKGTAFARGLATFYLACSIGAVINVQIAELARSVGVPWLIAGAIGLAIGAVWNYGMTSFLTWRSRTT
ncbi:MAG TPA: glycosyltransferase [Verrucomicrobiae bacterium]|nr:glycosyltransferase [Verrucomicrobiae bacterium]